MYTRSCEGHKNFLKNIMWHLHQVWYTLVGGVDMKHHISVTVRVDGGIEHQFDQVLEGRKKTFHLVCEAAQAMNYINQE
ncbi:hypothetical protein LCGC14_2747020, partial [marine sediment metagenome]